MNNPNTLIQKVREYASKLVHDKKVDGIVGLLSNHRHVGPHLYRSTDEFPNLTLEPRYPLAIYCRSILKSFPKATLGVIARGCDERAIIELAKLQQVDLERLRLVGIACSENQAQECSCARPYPTKIDFGNKVDGNSPLDDPKVGQLLERETSERTTFWQEEFSRCIKCYGCRNACPVCICNECLLEESCWVEVGQIPPQDTFHLIRTFHIADKCVGCGACEMACPMEIPLMILNKLMSDNLKRLFQYEPGLEVEERSPLITTMEEGPIQDV